MFCVPHVPEVLAELIWTAYSPLEQTIFMDDFDESGDYKIPLLLSCASITVDAKFWEREAKTKADTAGSSADAAADVEHIAQYGGTPLVRFLTGDFGHKKEYADWISQDLDFVITAQSPPHF